MKKTLIYTILVVSLLEIGILAFKRFFKNSPPKLLISAYYKVPGTLNNLPEINYGEYIYGLYPGGIIKESPQNIELPIASVTKIMTAYLILKDHPITQNNDPKIVITQKDYETYLKDKKTGQSVLKVKPGEILTEKQLLEGLLIPSGNNVATLLALWDSGSTKAFVDKMNKEAKKLGMDHTHYDDPAGISHKTKSTALDQLILAKKAMENRTFREIVSMAQANLPVSGIVYNVNYDLYKDNIVGIKTGSTPKDGGNFVFAAKKEIGPQSIYVYGALLDQGGKEPLMTALKEAKQISKALLSSLEEKTLIKKGEKIAKFEKDGKVVYLLAGKSLVLWCAPTEKFNFSLELLKNNSIKKGETIGYLIIKGNGKVKSNFALPLIASRSVNLI